MVREPRHRTERWRSSSRRIEYALRGLDKAVLEEREHAARAEKMLGDFQEQAGRPFEHEARLKELLALQAELNAALDLDNGERQVATPAGAGRPVSRPKF